MLETPPITFASSPGSKMPSIHDALNLMSEGLAIIKENEDSLPAQDLALLKDIHRDMGQIVAKTFRVKSYKHEDQIT